MRFLLSVLLICLALPGQAECRADRVDLRGVWGQAGFSVEVAQTNRERAKGLMFREELPKGQGMLFVYPFAHQVAFWMKNTLIPLDMIFLSSDGRVTYVHENAQPGDLTPVSGGQDVRYVLEINGGLARQIGISEGSELRSPFVVQSLAAWPCSE
ncbi:DUF192 domain-containing protein [Aliiroseovarius crassostreae]|uniref:DUF192 domain-containing protein n=1 Tax=Aliiroseovarius crassostreae TaxID=154981 RepID=UPI0021F9D334|nr:DUF192 domain-containing protein [Aliiroseovarius crassostreae]UWP93639.1 DUF192 domain-containing protein [Aliiroseovarius crassostreae]UWP99943.1 DUF192 domain-containing protein [Aliiroseovarius crassostreae]